MKVHTVMLTHQTAQTRMLKFVESVIRQRFLRTIEYE